MFDVHREGRFLHLWSRWREIDEALDAYAAHRSGETTVVILEPSPDAD